MKIAYNPTGKPIVNEDQLSLLKNDIIFDLSGMAVYARGIPVGKVYLPFEKSTSSTTEGYNGLVPFPDYNGNSKTRFLREDGTWVVPTNISINGTSILGNNNTALNLVAGTNITLSPEKDSNNKYTGKVIITASNHAWGNITGKPTTLAGYGITDAVDLTSNQTISGAKTFSNLRVNNSTLVTNLNAEMVGGVKAENIARQKVGIDIKNGDRNYMGYGYESNGWYSGGGPAICAGVKDYYMMLFGYPNALYYKYEGIGYPDQTWKTIAFTDSNITGNAATASALIRNTMPADANDLFDGRSTNQLLFFSEFSSATKNLPEEIGYDTALLHIGRHNSGTASQLYFGRSGNIHYRSSASGWKKIFFDNSNSLTPSGGTLTINGNLTATSFLGNLDGSYINKLTGYTKATTISAITANDTLNVALGKLEFKTDFIYNDLFGTDNDDIINKWHEIVDFIGSVKEGTDITEEFVTRKTTQTITGAKTFNGTTATILTVDRDSDNPTYIAFKNKGTLKGYLGIDSSENPVYTDTNVNKYKILHAGNYTNYKHSYTNLTGSTTTANQAIVSNGTKDGWKLLTLGSGAFLDDYPMLNLGTLSDYVEYVLLLHPIAKRNSSDNWTYYYSYGTIYTHRSNGLGPSSSITYNSIPKYGSSGPTLVYVSMMLQGRKYALWCTCTYNGLKYCGLKLYISTNHSADLTIKGRWNSDPVLVKYKKNQRTDSNGNITSEEIIHNEEIANSIVVEGGDIIINSTYGKFNGTFVTSGGTASQFVKGDGSLDSNTYAVHNTAVKNVTSLTHSTLGYAYNLGKNADTFWHTAGPVALFGTYKYLCAIQADASNNNVIKYKKVVNGSAQESWKTFVNSDGTQIGSSVRPVYVKNDGSVAPFTLSNATANDTRNILVGYDNGIYLVTSAKINPSTGILIANGFVKSGSTDSHVLLGAGGHKALSDFMMKGDDLAAHTITITKSIKLTKDWQETGIVINDATFTEGAGTYAVQVDINAGEATGFWYSLFSGIASFQTSCTNGTEPDDEILLHHSSHGCSKQIYLKTKPTQGGLGYYNKLYIACNTACSTAVNITFKFKKLI